MKRRSKRWLSLGLIVLASAALAGEPVPMSVQVKTGQVLDTPSFLGKVIARVNYGDRIPVIEQQGDFLAFKFHSLSPFIPYCRAKRTVLRHVRLLE